MAHDELFTDEIRERVHGLISDLIAGSEHGDEYLKIRALTGGISPVADLFSTRNWLSHGSMAVKVIANYYKGEEFIAIITALDSNIEERAASPLARLMSSIDAYYDEVENPKWNSYHINAGSRGIIHAIYSSIQDKGSIQGILTAVSPVHTTSPMIMAASGVNVRDIIMQGTQKPIWTKGREVIQEILEPYTPPFDKADIMPLLLSTDSSGIDAAIFYPRASRYLSTPTHVERALAIKGIGFSSNIPAIMQGYRDTMAAFDPVRLLEGAAAVNDKGRTLYKMVHDWGVDITSVQKDKVSDELRQKLADLELSGRPGGWRTAVRASRRDEATEITA